METFTSAIQNVFLTIFSGTNLALLGAALAIFCTGLGSAKGVGMVSEAAAGLLTEQPEKFGRSLALQALPATQGIYGFVVAFLIVALKLNALSGTVTQLSFTEGMYLLIASLPIAIAGYGSAVKQARVATAGITVLIKRPEAAGKAIISAALVELYAILSFLISVLLVLFFNPTV